ncbi:unnamed protein product, partial [Prorocentrum cordatum]
EWCADLPCGARANVSYLGDLVDHERVVVWPSRREEGGEVVDSHLYWVLSPDGDLWEELLSGASPADGPSGGERLAAGAAPPAADRKLYGFRERAAMEARGQTPAEAPASIELPSGALLDIGEGHVWALAEPAPGLPIGSIVDASTETLIGVVMDALWHRRGRAWRAEQMPEAEVVD